VDTSLDLVVASPLPFSVIQREVADSYIDFKEILGIEWALTEIFLRKMALSAHKPTDQKSAVTRNYDDLSPKFASTHYGKLAVIYRR
jgi:hypothetical protein